MRTCIHGIAATLVAAAGISACSAAPPDRPAEAAAPSSQPESLDTDFGSMTARATRSANGASAVLVDKESGAERATVEWSSGAQAATVTIRTDAGGQVKGTVPTKSLEVASRRLEGLNATAKGFYDSGRRADVRSASAVKPKDYCIDVDPNDPACYPTCTPSFSCSTYTYVASIAIDVSPWIFCYETDEACTAVFADCSTGTSVSEISYSCS